MSRVVWHQPEDRHYEYGTDRGVLYLENTPGIPWNGLISVDQPNVGGEVTSLYYDGIKYLDYVAYVDYQATIRAFGTPREFGPYLGNQVLVPGLLITGQPITKTFDLSFRTYSDGDENYKIHLVYNAMANPVKKSYQTKSETINPTTVDITIDAVPPPSDTFKPTAHAVIETRDLDPDILAALEGLLYGTDTSNARLPTILDIQDLVQNFYSYVITENETTGLSSISDGAGDISSTGYAGVYRVLPGSRLLVTDIDGLYEME